MIPRSIWRWMILDIKRKKKEKRIQLFGGLIGVCVAVASLFYFFHAEKAEAEKRMVEIVNYVKVQCSTTPIIMNLRNPKVSSVPLKVPDK
mgnify:FL=1